MVRSSSGLDQWLLYARGVADWPMDILKNTANNTYRGKGNSGRSGDRKKRPNMNHVSRRVRLKHRRAR